MTSTPVLPTPTDLIDTYRPQIEGHPILLFDGVCVFCNRTIQFLIRRDHDAILRFVPLESPLAKRLLAYCRETDGPEGIIFITNALTGSGNISRRSDAFSDVLNFLPTPWPAIGKVIQIVPRALRELVYGLIARFRYRIFGQYETCPIPSPEQRTRILGIPF